MTAEVSTHEGAPPPRFNADTFLKFGFGPDRAFECYVAEVANNVVGHVSITWGFDVQGGCRVIWLADLFVVAEHRRNGIGYALIAHVCERALSDGVGYIQFMVAPKNVEAIAFYEAIGSKRDRGIPMFVSPETIAEQSNP